MTETLIFFAIGFVLIAVLAAALLLRKHPGLTLAAESDKNRESQTALMALELELPSRSLAERIFAQDDWEFVSKEAPHFRQQFLKERKAVGLLWLGETRDRMARIHRFYRMAIRGTASVDVAAEFRTAANYFAFLFMIATAQSVIYLAGPLYVRGVVGRMFAAADRVSVAVGKTLAVLEPSLLARIKDDWARQSNPAV